MTRNRGSTRGLRVCRWALGVAIWTICAVVPLCAQPEATQFARDFAQLTLPQQRAEQALRVEQLLLGDDGTSVVQASGDLNLRAAPPSGFFKSLAAKTDELKAGEFLVVLETREVRTLFGSDTWLRVRRLCDCEVTEGWIYEGVLADGRHYVEDAPLDRMYQEVFDVPNSDLATYFQQSVRMSPADEIILTIQPRSSQGGD